MANKVQELIEKNAKKKKKEQEAVQMESTAPIPEPEPVLEPEQSEPAVPEVEMPEEPTPEETVPDVEDAPEEFVSKQGEQGPPGLAADSYLVMADFPANLNGVSLRFKKREVLTDLNQVQDLISRGYGDLLEPFNGIECPTCGSHMVA